MGRGEEVRRRDFIKGIVGATTVWPVVARAHPTMPVIGCLISGSQSVMRERAPILGLPFCG
jgi:hypothetical protein